MLLDGLHIPLTTPFYPDGRVYLRKLESNVARYSLTLASGLIALTGAGEAELLSDAESREVLQAVAEVAGKDKVLFAGVGRPGVATTLALAEAAAAHGYDAVLVAPPSAYLPQMWHAGEPGTALLTYLRTVADRSPLPVVLASHSVGGVLPVSAIAELAEHPNVLGLLEQSRHLSRVVDVLASTAHVRRTVTVTPTFQAVTGRMLRPQTTGGASTFVSATELLGAGSAVAVAPPQPALRTREKQVGFQVLWAHCAGAAEAFRAGACGFAPEMAAAVPQACFELWAAWKDGDAALMREKGDRIQGAEQALADGGPAAVKVASEGSGYFGGRPRLPLLAPTSAEVERLQAAFKGMRS